MGRFIGFSDEELDLMEDAFYQYGSKYLVDEIREERRKREKMIIEIVHGFYLPPRIKE